MSKVHTGHSPPADFQKMRSRRNIASPQEEIESQQIKKLQHLSFNSISSVQFCIDSAVGLPLSTTATRVTARLMAPDRSQVGELSAPSLSHPESDVCSPNFDLHMGWRGSSLQPSLTIVCRIDTLERPSLEPRCLGYAALKLCIDENGCQPIPDINHDKVYLNAGQFLLPIVYGKIPTNEAFTEEVMDKLPHIFNAFLRVRLFDPNAEDKSNSVDQYGPNVVSYYDNISPTSVIGTLLTYSSMASEDVPKLKINETLKDEIIRGLEIENGEKRTVLRQIMEWCNTAFPHISKKINAMIDPRFIVNYDDKFGAMVALDMLYNMPLRKNLIKSAKHMKPTMFGSRKWDNKINYYKTCFRYLPGITRQQIRQADQDLIIDDASVDLSIHSPELSPVYFDDFSRTTGIELSQHACVLVVVTACDIFTSNKATLEKPTNYFKIHTSQGKYIPLTHQQRLQIEKNDLATVDSLNNEHDEKLTFRQTEEKNFKLRGLVEISFANHDPNATWWGILPIMTENPFIKRDNKNNNGGGMKSPSPRKTANNNNNNNANLYSNIAMYDNGTTIGNSLSNNASTYFIDAGTHQIPLFEGLPPDEMIHAPNPYYWVINKLRDQNIKPPQSNNGCCVGCCACCCCNNNTNNAVVINNTLPSVTNSSNNEPLRLSPGASAIVSLVDPRLKRFCDDSITFDSSVIIKDDVVKKILRIYSTAPKTKDLSTIPIDTVKYKNNLGKFKFNIVKTIPSKKGNKKNRSLQHAIPENIFYDTLIKEVNERFIQSLSE